MCNEERDDGTKEGRNVRRKKGSKKGMGDGGRRCEGSKEKMNK